jgi:hypothetical protein
VFGQGFPGTLIAPEPDLPPRMFCSQYVCRRDICNLYSRSNIPTSRYKASLICFQNGLRLEMRSALIQSIKIRDTSLSTNPCTFNATRGEPHAAALHRRSWPDPPKP